MQRSLHRIYLTKQFKKKFNGLTEGLCYFGMVRTPCSPRISGVNKPWKHAVNWQYCLCYIQNVTWTPPTPQTHPHTPSIPPHLSLLSLSTLTLPSLYDWIVAIWIFYTSCPQSFMEKFDFSWQILLLVSQPPSSIWSPAKPNVFERICPERSSSEWKLRVQPRGWINVAENIA